MIARANESIPISGRVEALFKVLPILWFTSTREDGRPHLVPVWFSWDGESVFLISQPGSQKVKNIRREPRVMLALDDTQGGNEAVVFEGIATLDPEPAETALPPEYVAKYQPRMTLMKEDFADVTRIFSQVIRVRPTRFLET